jgi:hypothetical protein
LGEVEKKLIHGEAEDDVQRPESELMVEGSFEMLDSGIRSSDKGIVRIKFKEKIEWSDDKMDKIQSWIQEKQSFKLNEVEGSDRNVTEDSALMKNLDKMKAMDADDVSEAEHGLMTDNYSNTLKKAFG